MEKLQPIDFMIRNDNKGMHVNDRESGRPVSNVRNASIQYDPQTPFPILYLEIICSESSFICNNDKSN